MLFNPFAGKSEKQLLKEKQIYQHLIAQQQPNYIGPISSKTGKHIKPVAMPWMLPAWEKGLALVNAELAKYS